MKLFAALFLGIIITLSTFGQGTVIFDNQSISTGAAPITNFDGTRLAGTNFSAQLYSAPGLNQPQGSLTAAETRVQFRGGLNAGFVQTIGNNAFTGQPIDAEVTVTPVANGPATVQLRAWESRFPTYEAALAGGGFYGVTAPINLVTTGGGLLPGVELTGLQGFALVPEPSTLALAALGLVALFFRRK